MERATPLLGFLRALDKDQRKAFAKTTGTTVVYLYQLAGHPKPNPQLILAKAIVEETHRLAPKILGARALTYDDLLVGNTSGPLPDEDAVPLRRKRRETKEAATS